VTAVLLAAGHGTRLAPVIGDQPKILAEVGGRPLLERQLDYLAGNGVGEVVVNLHHLAERVETFLAGRPWPLAVRMSFEPELLGTAGALLPMRLLLGATFVVLYGDVLTDAPIADLLARHAATGAVATICCHVPDSWAGKGVVKLAGDGRVSGFAEKPARPSARYAAGYANAGLYALEPDVLAAIPGAGADFGFDVFPRLLAAGAPVHGYPYDGLVLDVGTPQALRRAEALARAGLLP
jgi:NDP-sugar pyrophosphorylase family protein